MTFVSSRAKSSLFALLVLAPALSALPSRADTKIIPLPASMQALQGVPLMLSNRSQIAATGEAAEAQFLAKQLRAATGFPLAVNARGSGAV